MQEGIWVQIVAKTWAKAILYVANEVIRVWIIILQQRGLGNEKLLQDKETINNGLFTWLLTHHLERAVLEMYQEGATEAVERWDMIFKYADPNKENVTGQEEVDDVWKTYLDEVLEFIMRKLNVLPSGTTYRVVVGLRDEVEGFPPPFEVSGWSPTTLRKADHLTRSISEATCDGSQITIWMEAVAQPQIPHSQGGQSK